MVPVAKIKQGQGRLSLPQLPGGQSRRSNPRDANYILDKCHNFYGSNVHWETANMQIYSFITFTSDSSEVVDEVIS
jgi:hypothetical protein